MTRFPGGVSGAGRAAGPAGGPVAAVLLGAVVLAGTAGCVGGGAGRAGAEHRVPLSPASRAAERPPEARETPAAPPLLTEEQARAALVGQDDLGGPWVPTRGTATWRDGLLKATTGDADCRRLLDALYADDLFGVPGGPRASVALDDVDSGAQVRQQVVAYRAADLDRTLDWMRTLPDRCGRFTATATAKDTGPEGTGPEDAGEAEAARRRSADVRVTEVPLPDAGDDRQGLRVTVTGTDAEGRDAVLTVEVAAVRVGEDAIGVTNGGLGDVVSGTTRAVTELGTRRLTEARKRGRAQI